MLTLVSPFSVLGDDESHIGGVSVLLADATYITNTLFPREIIIP